ncbi:hypothetical protein [Acetilactobacillus jinshanensis]|uniref:Uncharacterized protein n=1 Tax=Acetilactobacillus jinshanensis TaxID=1720083 RepID=A0A4P6ZMM4_9LACO|nr:hypothetical protein [Acetilactobacillus jinshanensis]QBP18857.1 hypothetical protein ELX58_07060 [Acetilactobacillus jinshanensis]URL61724.1 N-acetyltransferase [uncultured bacterium]
MIIFKPNAIMIKNQRHQIVAELTYFLLSSKCWLLEQLFASSQSNMKRYQGILIKQFFDRVPKAPKCVRILDPFAKAYVKKHQEYQKFLR